MPTAKRTKKTHKGVEFAVDDAGGDQRIFKTFDAAASFAVTVAAMRGVDVNLDVLIYNVSGARWWGGDYAVSEYRSDPDASVSDRIIIRAESVGRIA